MFHFKAIKLIVTLPTRHWLVDGTTFLVLATVYSILYFIYLMSNEILIIDYWLLVIMGYRDYRDHLVIYCITLLLAFSINF